MKKNFKIGLVGLTNVGKSSIFNSLTGKDSIAENRFFVTLEPEYASFTLFDSRLKLLADSWKSNQVTPTKMDLIDIPGLVKDAHLGYGLGKDFLSFIAEADGIFHVLRCFQDEEIFKNEEVDPLNDLLIVKNEMIFADLQKIEDKLAQDNISKKKKEISELEKSALEKMKKSLQKGEIAKEEDLSSEEKKIIKGYRFLTRKPFLLLLNCSKERKEDIEKFLFRNSNNDKN